MALHQIGLNDDCPFQYLTIGGISVPKWTQTVSGKGVRTKRDKVRGVVMDLTPEQIERIKAGAANKVIRSTRGKRARHMLWAKDFKGYKHNPETDRDVSSFVYIRPTREDPQQPVRYATINDLGREDEIEPPAPTPARRSRRRTAATKG